MQDAQSIIMSMLSSLGPQASINPNAVAQQITEEKEAQRWRRNLPKVKQAALHLARIGEIDILRKGKPVEPQGLKGVYRLRLSLKDGAAPIEDDIV